MRGDVCILYSHIADEEEEVVIKGRVDEFIKVARVFQVIKSATEDR